MMLPNFLATPYVMDTLLETMGLNGCQTYVFWVNHRNWGQHHLLDTVFLYLLSLSPPWVLMSPRVWASLFLSLLVGSFGMGLHVLVSENNYWAFLV